MTRIQITGAFVAIVLATASLFASIVHDPEIPFLIESDDADWITIDRPVGLETLLALPQASPRAEFQRSFRLEGAPSRARLDVNGLGALELRLNGRTLALPGGERACFKRDCTPAVDGLLRAGANRIEVVVRNATGPPLLRLRLQTEELALASDDSWQVSVDGGPAAPAIRADDTRPFLESRALPSAGAELRRQAPVLALAFLAACGLFVAARRALPPAALRHAPAATLAAVSGYWLYVFVVKFIRLPAHIGYDAKFHIEYIHWIAERHTLPLASDGFSMYHPPLFYGLAAGLVGAFSPAAGGPAEQAVLKLIPFLCGLGMVFATHGVMRWALPDDPRAACFAVLFAGTIPVNLYMSAYVSNEPLFALLTGAALLVATPLLLRPEKPTARLAALAVVLGLALMTKYTALITVPVFVFFIGFELVTAEGATLRRAGAIAAALLLAALAIGGWVYVRNWLHFGDPLIWNLDVAGGLPWWQPPGFRTADYYLGFGESLRHPWFALFHSFWDAFYSSTWGDAAPPSIYHLAERHTLWNYPAMSAGTLLALPATGLFAVGVAQVLAGAFTGDDRRRRCFFTLVAALLFALAFSVVSLSIRFPFWGALRASYALAGLVPATVCAGIGAASVDRWLDERGRQVLRAILYGWFAVFVAVLVVAFGG
jgi:hypothetical protein